MAAKKKTARKRTTRNRVESFDSADELRAFIAEKATREGAERLVPRGSVVNDPLPKPTRPEESPEEDATDDPILGNWGPRPSVAKQLERHSTTVRFKPPVTYQFLLSDPAQLATWNTLHAKTYPLEEPQLVGTYAQHFSPTLGSYIILAHYSEVEYQQI